MIEFYKAFYEAFKPYAYFSVFVFIGAIIVLIFQHKKYINGAYYKQTGLYYIPVRLDLGRYGEYLIYKNLQNLEKDGARFLFNTYVPKENGETSEIDVMMINSKGIFVFESKNYSGWIFGSEFQKNWCQTLPSGNGKSHKEYFYNPIMQNYSHIKHLTAFLNKEIPMYSVIAFSDRCTLKKIDIKNENICVINRHNVLQSINKISENQADVLSQDEISEIFEYLYPLTQVDEQVKKQHIENIKGEK